jgi:hypothetical protein
MVHTIFIFGSKTLSRLSAPPPFNPSITHTVNRAQSQYKCSSSPLNVSVTVVYQRESIHVLTHLA